MSEKTKDDFMGRVSSYTGEVVEGAHDAVFGEITEDGPNYRAVCFSRSTVMANIQLTYNRCIGRMEGNSCPDDEDPDRSGRPLYPRRL